MNYNSGRRAAIIDEIENRLKQIKISKGYNLDVALVQKRFPNLTNLTQGENTTEFINEDYSDMHTMPTLLLQYGSTDNEPAGARTTGPSSQLGGSSRFANINQLEEQLVIVIRGIVVESQSTILLGPENVRDDSTQSTINADANDDSIIIFTINSGSYPIVKNEAYSIVPEIGQIHCLLENALPLDATEDLSIKITGTDINNDTLTEILSVTPTIRQIYIDSSTSPSKPSFTDIDSLPTDWYASIPDSITNTLYTSIVSILDNSITVSTPFKQTGTNITLIYGNFKDLPNKPTDSEGTWNNNRFVLSDDSKWKKIEGALKEETNKNLYGLIVKENDDGEPIYDNPFKLPLLDTPSENRNIDRLDVIFSRDYSLKDLKDTYLIDENIDEFIPDNWYNEIPEEENDKPLYAAILQIDSENCITYSRPFRIISMEDETPNISSLYVDSNFYFKTIDEIECSNFDSNSIITASSLPLPLTSLVSLLHADIQKALYNSEKLLEPRTAAGLIKEFYEKNTFTEDQFKDRVEELIETTNIINQKAPKNASQISLGISGVHDFTITGWETLEGAGFPFEVINFRLVIWHTYPKGASI